MTTLRWRDGEITGAGSSVAVVGAACRFPGASDTNEFWDLMLSGRDVVGQIPQQRFDAKKWYSPEPGRPRRIVNLSGGFLENVDGFDADFFNITPSEAEQMDPQQRVLMEVAWRAIEDAGQTAENLAGSNTGVYLTTFSTAYWDMMRSAGHFGPHAAMGAETGGIIAGRLSYHLDLRGPSLAISATCATPLVAVHVATRALQSREIDLAIVGGATLILSPDVYFALSESNLLSRSGRCRFGDVGADGYVRSEGAGVVILKRLEDAERDGDRPYAAIVGSAMGHYGRTGSSMMSPGQTGQEATLRAAYADAGVGPGTVAYVEAHGAGTAGGDPVELRALSTVLGEQRPAGQPCLVGSVKSNIGHLEGVAGFAGLIKAALVLRHRTVPATLNVREPAPPLRWPDSPLRLVRGNQPLPDDRPAVVGVSAFGANGSVAHLVLAECAGARHGPDAEERSGYLLPLSARHPKALATLAGQYAELLHERDSPALADVCHTAGARRTHFERRIAVVGADRAELVAGLAAVAAGERTEHVIGDGREMAGRPRVVFVYPGQGSQWPGMARDLLRTNRTFADRLAECDRAVREELGWSLIEHIERGDELTTMDRVQPTLWAVQVALAEVWREWGVEPDLVIGHSMGEVAAAVTSGALTVADGATVICRRSALLAARREPGAMWAVQLGEPAARRVVEKHGGEVCVGVVNSHRSTVLSGDPVALAEIADSLREDGVFCRQVPVDYASHALQLESLRPRLVDALSGLRPRPGQVPIHSTVLDRVVDDGDLDATYWADNLILPVRFDLAVLTTLADAGRTVFVEISPHPILHAALEDGISAARADATTVASLRRDEPGLTTLLAGLATVYTEGGQIAFERVDRDGRFADLPLYPWQHKRFWVDGPSSNDVEWPPCDDEPPQSPADEPHPVDEAAITTLPDRVRHIRLRVSTLLGVPDIEPSVPLVMQGLDSVFAVRLAYQIRTELGLEVTSSDLLTGRSIEQLAGDLPGPAAPSGVPSILAEAG
ncbi:type I polyketide synthase [Actinophytocola sp.]|uniref:type I polyketide synthase n=1 Tax=Actinophytocola sp. TaxID=1872138 RepID=UPI002ED5A696